MKDCIETDALYLPPNVQCLSRKSSSMPETVSSRYFSVLFPLYYWKGRPSHPQPGLHSSPILLATPTTSSTANGRQIMDVTSSGSIHAAVD
jgi:hypothetical protein